MEGRSPALADDPLQLDGIQPRLAEQLVEPRQVLLDDELEADHLLLEEALEAVEDVPGLLGGRVVTVGHLV